MGFMSFLCHIFSLRFASSHLPEPINAMSSMNGQGGVQCPTKIAILEIYISAESKRILM